MLDFGLHMFKLPDIWVRKFIKVMKLITDLIRTKRIQLWNPVDIRFDQSNQPGAIQLIIDKFFFFAGTGAVSWQ